MVKYALLWYSGLCRLKIWWLTWVRLGTKGLKYPLCTWMQLRFYCLDPQKQKAFCPTEKTSIAFIYWLANFPARIKKVYRLWTRGDTVDSSIIVFFSSVFCNNIRLVSDTRRNRLRRGGQIVQRGGAGCQQQRPPTSSDWFTPPLISREVTPTKKKLAQSVVGADLLWFRLFFWFLTLLHDTQQLLQWFCLREAHVKRCTSFFPFIGWRGWRSEVERQQVLRSRRVQSVDSSRCLTNNHLKYVGFTVLRF